VERVGRRDSDDPPIRPKKGVKDEVATQVDKGEVPSVVVSLSKQVAERPPRARVARSMIIF
jgi:hypothetical protein